MGRGKWTIGTHTDTNLGFHCRKVRVPLPTRGPHVFHLLNGRKVPVALCESADPHQLLELLGGVL